MCGIVAGVAEQDVVNVLTEGLKRLEYRGYDSCGVAVLAGGEIRRARSVSRVKDLCEQVAAEGIAGALGIAHTRWATHGGTVIDNAHPHIAGGRVALVHNGIIENFAALREELAAQGAVFESQTDTEVLAHLIDHYYDGRDLLSAVARALARAEGSYAIAAFSRTEPGRIVGARQGSPMVLGVGERAHYVASDAMALAGVTERIVFLQEGDVVDITSGRWQAYERDGAGLRAAERPVARVLAYGGVPELGPYRHFMQKEIFEQPRAIADTLEGVAGITPQLFGDEGGRVLAGVKRILMLACGTSYYAACTAKYWIESIARVPCDVEIASEFRYRSPVLAEGTLVVAISQSGETADTIAAVKYAQRLGVKATLAICNVEQSELVRSSDLHYITRAGVEVGVASTKAFTTQLAALYLLTLTLGKLRGEVGAEREAGALGLMRHIPRALSAVLALEPQVIAWAESFARKRNALFLGRGMHYPIALEGALKLKEISYIHAEAYPAGELKHGPLALVDEAMPVVTVAPSDELLGKLKSNMQEVRARGGELYVFADADTGIEPAAGLHVIRMPENYGDLSPVLHVIVLQLLAYHTAVARGTDVDKPRNLAKSVTVE